MQGRFADKVIERIFKAQKKWGARDRRFVAESIYEIVRWRRYLGVLAGFDAMDPKNQSPAHVLQLWGAWCYNTYHELPDWADFKNFDREAFKKAKASVTSVAVRESIPDWLYTYCHEQLGPEWDEALKALNQPAEVFLRANTLRGTREDLIQKLRDENIDAVPVKGLDAALRLSERKNVFMSAAFKQGLFEMQDAASQMVAPLLQVEPGQRVVDACAGAGGKSLHLAALMKNKGKILSLDIHDWKLDELKERARRNRVDIIETRLIDSTKVIKRLEDSADRLLLDVPCSGLGVLRRNPDKKWKISLEEIERLQALQKELLDSYSGMLKVGGLMVYATCSLLPSENDQQIAAFLKRHPEKWALEKQVYVWPQKDGYDGFYAALLRRQS